MNCCKGEVKELLGNCHSNDCGCGEHKCDPLFDIASPIEGQILRYSEEFKAFINVMLQEASQVNADWNALSGISQILNKPTIPAEYLLPTASSTVLGGIKIGDMFSVLDGVLTGNFILNQKALEQPANIWIGGDILAGARVSMSNNNNPCTILGSSDANIGNTNFDTNCSSILSSQNVSIYGNRNTMMSSSSVGFSSADVGNTVILVSSQMTSNGTIYESIVSANRTVFNGNISRSFIFGEELTVNSQVNLYNTYVLGRNITFELNYDSYGSFNDCIIVGSNHTVSAYHANSIFGQQNSTKTYACTIGGISNSIGRDSYYSSIFGERNTIGDRAYSSFIAGTNNTITSNDSYDTSLIYCNFIYGESNEIINKNLGSDSGYLANNAILSGSGNEISGIGAYHVILSGQTNRIANDGYINYGYYSYDDTFINVSNNTSNKNWINASSIISGSNNAILSNKNSSIVGGSSNLIGTSHSNTSVVGDGNAILGGYSNKIISSDVYDVTYASIIGGSNNNIIHNTHSPSYVYYSSILGGNNNTILSGRSSIINSNSSYLNGEYSTIIGGEGNKVQATNTHVIGSFLKTNTNNKIVLGRYNNDISTNILELGFGTSNALRKNAFWIKNNGTMGTASFITNGVKTPTLGSNCPALDQTKPYAWIQFELSDGSTVYMPAWK